MSRSNAWRLYPDGPAAPWCECTPSLWSAPLCCPTVRQPWSGHWSWLQSVWTEPAGHWVSERLQTQISSPWKRWEVENEDSKWFQMISTVTGRFSPFTGACVSSIRQLNRPLKRLLYKARSWIHSAWHYQRKGNHNCCYKYLSSPVSDNPPGIPPEVLAKTLFREASSGQESRTRASPSKETWNHNTLN